MTPRETLNLLHADQKRAARIATARTLNYTGDVMQRVTAQKNMKGHTVMFILSPGRTQVIVRRPGRRLVSAAVSRRLDSLWGVWRTLFWACAGFNTTSAWLVAQDGRVRRYNRLSAVPEEFREDATPRPKPRTSGQKTAF